MEAKTAIEKIRILNHFEYKGPLTRRELFFDRKQELEDALIACEQIVRGGIGGVMVLGGRGSGKTSFLDALCRELTARKIPNAKISLDEGMVKEGNENLFIKTILSDLLKASRVSGLLEDKLVSKILDVLGGLAIIDEIGIDLGGFGVVARSAKEKSDVQFPYTVLRDGLKDFLRVIGEKGSPRAIRGAILLLDEGDALTLNKNLLQILRNVFQETPKVGLVVAGSTGLLNQVSPVFSPLPRFFTKIELGPYPADWVVQDAISVPLAMSTKDLLTEGLKVTFIHSQFDRIVTQISGRMPLEVNMLSNFAYDVGAKRISRKVGDSFVIYMKADRELFEEAMKQLVGTREYGAFIGELEKHETSCLVLLSKSFEGMTTDELAAVMALHELGDNLQTMSVADAGKKIESSINEKEKIISLLASINAKGQEHKINVFFSTLMGKPRFSLEDQFIRAYFKYSWSDIDVDLEVGLKPFFGGIRVFGDPIATMIHSVFFPRLASCLGSRESFRAHVKADTGHYLSPARGCKIINVVYDRTATKSPYHIAFQVKQNTDVTPFKKAIEVLMDCIKKAGLVENYGVLIR